MAGRVRITYLAMMSRLKYFCDRRLMERGETHDERLRRDWDVDKQFPQAVAAINRSDRAVSSGA